MREREDERRKAHEKCPHYSSTSAGMFISGSSPSMALNARSLKNSNSEKLIPKLKQKEFRHSARYIQGCQRRRGEQRRW